MTTDKHDKREKIMNKYRTFSIPLRDESSFVPRYKLEDIGFANDDFKHFNYIDVYGSHSPPIDEVPDEIKLEIGRTFFTQYVPVGDNIEYSYRLEITSVADISSDIILRLLSLPGVNEIDTNLFHLSNILKSALLKDEPIDDILTAIKGV